jgi:hypothetical protein
MGVWKFIRMGWDIVAKYLRFEVGEGSHIRFWHDLWCGNRPLKLCYLALYSIARYPDVWVVDNLSVECSLYALCLGMGGGDGDVLL